MIHKNQTQNPNYITSQINFLFRTRMLWRDMATWFRSYKVSLYGGVGNTDELSQHLFQLPSEYGNILRVFFSDQATQQLINILTQYISILQSLFIAQINNDTNEINNLTQQAYQSVNSTAAFLASINPYWTQSEWVTLLNSFTSEYSGSGYTGSPVVGNRNSGKMETGIPVAETANYDLHI